MLLTVISGSFGFLNTLRVVRQKHIVSFLTYYMGNVKDDDDSPQQSNQLPVGRWCYLNLTKDLTYPLETEI